VRSDLAAPPQAAAMHSLAVMEMFRTTSGYKINSNNWLCAH
jgi:hypothetical protein